MVKQVVGVFESQEETIQAIRDLTSQGYDRDHITVISNRRDNDSVENRTGANVDNGVHSSHDGDSFWDKVKDYFAMDDETSANSRLGEFNLSPTEEDAYASHLDDGKYLLAVEGSDTDAGTGVYQSGSSYDNTAINNNDTLRTNDYATNGFNSRTTNDDRSVNGGNDFRQNNQLNESDTERTLRLREQKLDVSKKAVQTGEVQVNKEVYEEQESIDVPVKREEVYVERHSVDGASDKYNSSNDAGSANFDNRAVGNETIRVPIVEEQIQVTKKPVVTDEIVIGKRTVEETKHVTDTVKKEEARLDKSGSARVDGEESFDSRDGRVDGDHTFTNRDSRFAEDETLTSRDSRIDRDQSRNSSDNRF